MADEPHEVVKLLLKRMESHPEEFRIGDGPFHDRWYDHVNGIHAYGSEADKAAMAAGLRKIRLAEIHEKVMDELLNGDERRRKAEEEAKYERGLMMKNTQQQLAAHQNAVHRYKNAIGQHGYAAVANGGTGQAQALGIGTQSPSQPLTIGTGGKEIMRIKADGGVITQPNLSSSAINQIKKALGI
jgi:hypothetical protein